jgi:hypothetical protein
MAAIQAALIKYGPLMVVVNADTWGYYSGGIFGSACTSASLNHAVTLVGYGSKNGVPVWVVKNSWGTGFGVNGYAFVRRGSTSACGIHTHVFSALVQDPPAAKWINHGNGFQGAARSGASAVFHGGLITTGTTGGVSSKWSTNPTIRRLSAAVAPQRKFVFQTMVNNNAVGRVDVFNGVGSTNFSWSGGGAGIGWISLDSIVYSLMNHTGANFSNGWVNYGGVFEPVGFASDNGAVYVAGLAKHAAFPKGKAVFNLPVGFRPSHREIFVGLAQGVTSRIDVLPTGDVLFVASKPVSGYVSFSNIHFRPAGAAFTRIPLINYWVQYSGYAPIGAHLGPDARVFLRGMVKSGKAATLGTLPVKFRPLARRMFTVACSTGSCRIDILASGLVQLAGKKYGSTGSTAWPSWISLSGIAYDASPDTTGF